MPLFRSVLTLLIASSFLACDNGKSPKDADILGDSAAADTGMPDTTDTDPVDTGAVDTSTTGTDPADTAVIDTSGDTASSDDWDGDFLTNDQEAALGTDPNYWDSDYDLLSDWLEVLMGTDPLNPDSDGDGLQDGSDEDPLGATEPDADGDGLSDATEALFGTDPNAADSDGDGLSDVDELWGDTDPTVADTDGDGLTDGEEVAEGSDPNNADSDGDGISDGDEVRSYGTSPILADTDGDGAADDVEVAAGSDPNDVNDYPGVGAGDAVLCEPAGVVEASGREFYDAGIAEGYGASAAEDLYEDWNRYRYFGTECSCTFDLYDPTPVAVTGVSVWIPSRAHDGTQWEPNPLPAAVMLDVPATWADTSRRFTDGAEADDLVDDLGNLSETWFAFDDVASNPDTSWNLSDATPFDTSGTYTVWVSFANVDGESMDTCDVLSDATAPEDALHLRIDTPSSGFAAPPSPPAADPMACTPGAQGMTTFALANLGGATRPLPIGGAPSVGAGALEVRVTNWKGADRLELRRDASVVAVLTPEQPRVVLGAPMPLSGARWRSGRSSGGTWGDPVVQVRHTCPTGPGAKVPSAMTTVAWAELNSALEDATGGFGLDVWQEGLADNATAGVRAWIERGGVGRPDHLIFESPDKGRLEALLLVREGDDRWTFRHRRANLALEGSIVASGNDLLLQLDAGAFTVAGTPVTLSPASLLLLGVSAE